MFKLYFFLFTATDMLLYFALGFVVFPSPNLSSVYSTDIKNTYDIRSRAWLGVL